MKQVVVIGGGDAFSTHDEYVAFLKNFRIENIEFFKPRSDWKANLQSALGEEYEVLVVRMPSKSNAKYAEWKIWFEKVLPFLTDDVVLVGHSLGASFLTKYLSEERFAKRVTATLLVAGPYDVDEGRSLPEFAAPSSLTLLEQRGGKVFLYYSKDDSLVPFSELAKYQLAFPSASVRIFEDRGHFNQEQFPELVADIQALPN